MLKKIMPFLILVLFIGWATPALAGFGVSPPRIKNHQLTPGSIYPVKIMLLRSSAEEELRAVVKIDAPEIESWIKLDKEDEFVLPAGELQVPMTVTFNIPKNAELGNYTGNINIKVLPKDRGAGVSIALGARIDIDIALTNVSDPDFLVRTVSIPDFERLGSPWNWKFWSKIFDRFFYRIRIVANVENTSSVDTAPSKISLEVYDLAKNNLLESSEDKTMKKVKAFSTGSVEAAFPTKLATGQYWGKVKIYKENEVVNFYEIAFSVENPGVLGAGARSLGAGPWALLGGLIFVCVFVVVLLIRIRFWRFILALLLLPTKPLAKNVGAAASGVNKNFWKWIAKQAEKHKDK
jgi:hypothetical protein